MKIHFIKSLIGLDDLPNFKESIRRKINLEKNKLPVSVDGLKTWQKYDILEDLNLDKYDIYKESIDKIKEYEYILNSLP